MLRKTSSPFHSVGELALALVLVGGLLPLSLYYLFYDLSNPLLDPHPWRQAQTALAAQSFFVDGINFWKYPTTLNGELWNFTREFPLYQAVVAVVMHLGLSLEVASRLVSIASFFTATAYLGRLVSCVFGLREGVWASLLYATLPFTIIFARTCLIDFMAQALTLAFLFHAVRYLEEKPGYGRRLTPVAVLGLFAVLTKIPFWMLGSVFLGGWIAVTGLIRHRLRPQEKAMIVTLAIQGVLGALWAKHAQGTYLTNIASEEMNWLAGPLSIRYIPTYWKMISVSLSRGVLNTWLIIPFVAGMLWPSPYRRLFWLLVVGCFFSVVFWFRIHAVHDYYFLIELPFLMAIAAYGLVRIFEVGRFHRVWYGVMLLAFIFSLRGLPHRMETISYDYRQRLNSHREFAEIVEPDEIVYTEEIDLSLPLYAHRYVAYPDVKGSGGITKELAPRLTVFRFPMGEEKWELLAGKKVVGLTWDSQGHSYLRTDPFMRGSTQLVFWNDDADLKPGERHALVCQRRLDGPAEARWQVVNSSGQRAILPHFKYLGATKKGAAECNVKASRLPSFQTRN